MAGQMMSAVSAERPAWRRAPPRFTLGGMLVTLVVVLSVGFGYSRWEGVTFWGAMLLSFTIWLVIGLLQTIGRQLRSFPEPKNVSHIERWGRLLKVLVPGAAIVLLSIVSVAELGGRFGWFASFWQRELADVLFFLAIIAAYWQPRQEVTVRAWSSRIAGKLLSALLSVLGLYWAAKIIASESEIFRMVFRAIRGIERSQPTTWAGHPFSPALLTISEGELHQVFSDLAIASLAMLAAIVASVLLLYFRRSSAAWRTVLLTAWIVNLGAAALYLAKCWNTGPADVSPLRMLELQQLGMSGLVLLSVLLVSVVTAASLHFAATVATAPSPADGGSRDAAVPLHQRADVMLFGLCAILGRIAQNFWQNAVGTNSAPVEEWILDGHVVWLTVRSLCQEYALNLPRVMIWVAAAVMLGRCLWQRWRGPRHRNGVWRLEPDAFFTIWIVALVTLVMATPIAVWWALVATLLP
jgi:hypothetical protein